MYMTSDVNQSARSQTTSSNALEIWVKVYTGIPAGGRTIAGWILSGPLAVDLSICFGLFRTAFSTIGLLLKPTVRVE